MIYRKIFLFVAEQNKSKNNKYKIWNDYNRPILISEQDQLFFILQKLGLYTPMKGKTFIC